MTTRPKTIPGYRIQPMLPISVTFAGGQCIDAFFSNWEGQPCVETYVWFGLAKSPYLLHLTIDQALEADIIERSECSSRVRRLMSNARGRDHSFQSPSRRESCALLQGNLLRESPS